MDADNDRFVLGLLFQISPEEIQRGTGNGLVGRADFIVILERQHHEMHAAGIEGITQSPVPCFEPIVDDLGGFQAATIVVARNIVAGISQGTGDQAMIGVAGGDGGPIGDIPQPKNKRRGIDHAADGIGVGPARKGIHRLNGRDQVVAVAVGLDVLIGPAEEGQIGLHPPCQQNQNTTEK